MDKDTQQAKSKIPLRTRIITGTAIGIVFVAVSGYIHNKTSYNSTYESNFLASCQQQGASTSSCACAYDQLKQQYSYSQAKYFDANPNAPDTQDAYKNIASQCAQSN